MEVRKTIKRSTKEAAYTADQLRAAAAVPDVDALAQFIRCIDGGHNMGAGVLADKICEWLATTQPEVSARWALTHAEIQELSEAYTDDESEGIGFRDGWKAAERHHGIEQPKEVG